MGITYKTACIMYLEQNMECVGYRDYIIKQLNKLEQIEQIIETWNGNNSFDSMVQISEVLEK